MTTRKTIVYIELIVIFVNVLYYVLNVLSQDKISYCEQPNVNHVFSFISSM